MARPLALLLVVVLVLLCAPAQVAAAAFTVNVYANASMVAADGGLLLRFTAQQSAIEGTYSMETGGTAGTLTLTAPALACPGTTPVTRDPASAVGTPWIALVRRGTCDFRGKVYNVQQGGAAYALVYDNMSGPLMIMSGSAIPSMPITIPSAAVTLSTYALLVPYLEANGGSLYAVFDAVPPSPDDDNPLVTASNDLIIFMFVPFLVVVLCSAVVFVVGRIHLRRQLARNYPRHPHAVHRHVAPAALHDCYKALPVVQITDADIADPNRLVTCAICLDDFVVGENVKRLPCRHEFHVHCLQPWIDRLNRVCPTCKQDVLMAPVPGRAPVADVGGMVAIEMDNLADVVGDDDGAGAAHGPLAGPSPFVEPRAEAGAGADPASPVTGRSEPAGLEAVPSIALMGASTDGLLASADTPASGGGAR